MRFIRDLNFDTAKLLERIYKESVHSQVRQRAHCILLSYKGVTIPKLIEQEKRGEIDLRYLDESGFCLTPYVPYGWQEKGENIPIKSSRSRRLNILGLMNRNQELDAYIFEGRITSEVVISCLDKFAENLSIKTVVVIRHHFIQARKSRLKSMNGIRRIYKYFGCHSTLLN